MFPSRVIIMRITLSSGTVMGYTFDVSLQFVDILRATIAIRNKAFGEIGM